MKTLIYIIVIYISFFVGLFGFVWCTRKISKSLRRRRDAKKHKARLREMTRKMKNGSYDKQALDLLIRNVTKKSKYN